MAPKLSFSLKDISKYRSELMGFSIIWIMMLHFQFEIVKPLGFIAQYGFAGVEIFMFVSGLGIYYSLDKNRQIIPYYLKRIRRIFPAYYIVGIFASLFLYNDNLFIFYSVTPPSDTGLISPFLNGISLLSLHTI